MDRIAYGGMAEIFRAMTFDRDGHQHFVAVKRVLAHLAEDDSFIQMLIDEAKIATGLRHPNIAQVYEFARANEEYFLAMEWVDGKDLRTILRKLRKKKVLVPPEHAAYMAAEVANALHAAHTASDEQDRPLRIVHRDISPSNILCAYTGEVKLCDFGIAKATLSKVNTKTGVIKGKIKYMSPEQALGRKLDHRTDIFSLGSCLYEMLTLTPPFVANTEMDTLIKVRDAEFRRMSAVVPSIPDELEGICNMCLTRARSDRYANAGDLARDLNAFTRRYFPGYLRSHFGRFMRELFAEEIEHELRKLEDFIVTDSVDADLGENLLAHALGPGATYSKFTPRQTNGGENRTPATINEQAKSEFDLHSADTLILPNRRPR